MTTAIAVGDSITYGTDASPTTNGYAYLVAASKGWTLDNRGVGGAMLCDAFDRVLTESITDSTVILGNYACNDHGALGDSNPMDARVHDWQKELLAFAAWVTIPDADKVTAKGGDVSYTGTWTNSTVYGTNDTAKVASVVGAKASFNYTIADGRARVLYICYVSPATGEGQFKVTVNGVDEGTYACSGACPGAWGNWGTGSVSYKQYSYQAIRIEGLDSGPNAVEIEVVTTGDVYFGWAAQPAWGPLFYLGNASQATGSYAYINPSIVQENIRSLEVYNTLLADGAKIVYVDNYVHCTSLSDGLHPDNTGHFQYAQGYINAVVPSAPPIFAQPSNTAPFWIWTIVGVAAVLTIGVVAHLVGGRRPAKPRQA